MNYRHLNVSVTLSRGTTLAKENYGDFYLYHIIFHSFAFKYNGKELTAEEINHRNTFESLPNALAQTNKLAKMTDSVSSPLLLFKHISKPSN